MLDKAEIGSPEDLAFARAAVVEAMDLMSYERRICDTGHSRDFLALSADATHTSAVLALEPRLDCC